MRMQGVSLRGKAWSAVFGALLVLSVSACGSSQGAGGKGKGDTHKPSAGELVRILGAESDWRLTLTPGSGGGSGVRVTIMDATPDKAVDPSSADLGSRRSLTYLLSVELRDGRLRRCIARHPGAEGDFVGTECRLDDREFVVKVGQGNGAGHIVFEFTPAGISGNGNELTGKAKMEHPKLPLDLSIGRADLVRVPAEDTVSPDSGSASAHGGR